MVIPIEFDDSLISAEQILDVLHRAGFSIGLGDWRPQLGGEFGRFSVQADE